MTQASRAVIRRGYVDYSDGQLHYRMAGSMIAPCIVLLHQSPSGSVMYESLMTALRDRFYLIAPDLPGFGQSDALTEPPTIERYSQAVVACLDAMGISRCVVFGHHTGASVAAQLAHDEPDRVAGLVLSGPPLLDESLRQTLPSRAEPFPLADDGGHLLQMWERMRDKDPAAAVSLSQRELLAAFECGASYPDSYAAVARHDFEALLPHIRCPALVFAGDQDPLYGAVAPTVTALPSARSCSLRGGETTYVCDREVAQLEGLIAQFCADLKPAANP